MGWSMVGLLGLIGSVCWVDPFDWFHLLGLIVWSVVVFDFFFFFFFFSFSFFFFSHGFNSYGFGFIVLGWWVCWVSRTWIVMFWVWSMKNAKNGEEHEEQYTHAPSFHWNGAFKLISSCVSAGKSCAFIFTHCSVGPTKCKTQTQQVQLNSGSKHTHYHTRFRWREWQNEKKLGP